MKKRFRHAARGTMVLIAQTTTHDVWLDTEGDGCLVLRSDKINELAQA